MHGLHIPEKLLLDISTIFLYYLMLFDTIIWKLCICRQYTDWILVVIVGKYSHGMSYNYTREKEWKNGGETASLSSASSLCVSVASLTSENSRFFQQKKRFLSLHNVVQAFILLYYLEF